MIWNHLWSIDKEDTQKDVVEVEAGATGLDGHCWMYVEEDVEVFPGYFTREETPGIFTKLVVPDSVTEVRESALRNCETVREISVLTNVTKIGKNAFKGCNGLAVITAPLVRVTELEDPEAKMKVAFGFCMNSDLYSDEIAADYLAYLKSQKSRVLRTAEKYNMPEIEAFLIQKGIVTGKASSAESKSPAGKKKKLSALDAILLLEKTVLTGDAKELESVIAAHAPFELTARALGLACRCRSKEIVAILLKNHATFAFDTKTASKYGLNCKQSARTVPAQFQLLTVENNIWNQYIFGSFEKHYAKTSANIVEGSVSHTSIDLSPIPDDIKMASAADRLVNIQYLLDKKVISNADINKMLYYAILGEEYDVADALSKMGAYVDVPWIVASADHSATISELNQYLDTMDMLSADRRVKILSALSVSLKNSGNRMYINENIWAWLDASTNFEIAEALLENGDATAINKTKFMKNRLEIMSPGTLKVVLDHGFITSTKLRDELIKLALEKKRADLSAVLLDYKNKTADLAAEEEKKLKKELKELTAAPDSVYELKKIWISKKKDDGTLVITAYKGEDTEVVVPSKIGKATVTELGAYIFSPEAPRITNRKARSNLRKIVVPDTVTAIGASAFAKCKKLECIELPNGEMTFGKRVFLDCENLAELKLPAKTTGKLSWYFFSGCKKLKELFIPAGVEAITEWSFYGCSGLRAIHFRKGTKRLYFSSLEECKKATIFAPNGSYAQQFAQEHNMRFEEE